MTLLTGTQMPSSGGEEKTQVIEVKTLEEAVGLGLFCGLQEHVAIKNGDVMPKFLVGYLRC